MPAFPFVASFGPVLPYWIGFAAGATTWVVFSGLIPDALEETSHNLLAVVTTVPIVAFRILMR